MATDADARRRVATDAFHEGCAERTERTGIGNVRGLRQIVEIPFVNDDS
jgi:hypothetical protein